MTPNPPSSNASAPQLAPQLAPQWRVSFKIERLGESRMLEVNDVDVTVALCAENAIIVELLKMHARAMAAHDRSLLTEEAFKDERAQVEAERREEECSRPN